MENTSNNWLALLRRKIQKKFKRNRHKVNNTNNCEITTETETINTNNNNNDGIENQTQNQVEVEEQQQQDDSEAEQQKQKDDYNEMKKELHSLKCFWPNISRLDAQKILTNKPNGSFLIRNSDSDRNSFTLSFRSNFKTFHCRNRWNEILNCDSQEGNLISAIEESIKKSQKSVVGFVVKCEIPIAVRLLFPVNREIPSLQNLCLNLLVNQIKNQSNINSLPIPGKIKKKINEYVHENYNTL